MPQMNITRTDAITCRCRAYSETSQTVQLYTRDCGMVSGLAKGVLRPQNSFGGPFDTLSAYEIIFIRKNGTGLQTVSSANLLQPFSGLREDKGRYMAANFILEVILGVAGDGESSPALYDLFYESFEGLEHGGKKDPVALGFAIKAMELTGQGLKYDRCALCGNTGVGGNRVSFAPPEGGLLCSTCAAKSKIEMHSHQGGMIRVRAGEMRTLAALAASETAQLSRINLSPDIRKSAVKIVGHALRFVLEKPPVMLKYMF